MPPAPAPAPGAARQCARSNVLNGPRPHVVRLRADDATALLLLEYMGTPAGRAAHGEQRSESAARDIQRFEQRRRIIFDIGVEPLARLVLAQRGERMLLD